jgi:hypothetical protein
MSEYIVLQTEYRDPECIKASLKELGYPFEEHKTEQNLYGYMGDKRQQTASIIVRRQHVQGASNDVGFSKKENGNYELIISEYDRGVKKTANDFLEQLKMVYNKHKALKKLKRLGAVISSVKQGEDGRIKIKARG